jgi:hypothetical protein
LAALLAAMNVAPGEGEGDDDAEEEYEYDPGDFAFD